MSQRAAMAEAQHLFGERDDPRLTAREQFADFVDSTRYGFETLSLAVTYIVKKYGPVREPATAEAVFVETQTDQAE